MSQKLQSILLEPNQIKENHPNIWSIFFNYAEQRQTPRYENESLHDFLIRIKVKCFCNDCRQTRLL